MSNELKQFIKIQTRPDGAHFGAGVTAYRASIKQPHGIELTNWALSEQEAIEGLLEKCEGTAFVANSDVVIFQQQGKPGKPGAPFSKNPRPYNPNDNEAAAAYHGGDWHEYIEEYGR